MPTSATDRPFPTARAPNRMPIGSAETTTGMMSTKPWRISDAGDKG
jgi:hypothetical protein